MRTSNRTFCSFVGRGAPQRGGQLHCTLPILYLNLTALFRTRCHAWRTNARRTRTRTGDVDTFGAFAPRLIVCLRHSTPSSATVSTLCLSSVLFKLLSSFCALILPGYRCKSTLHYIQVLIGLVVSCCTWKCAPPGRPSSGLRYTH